MRLFKLSIFILAGTSGINECMQDTNSTKDTSSNNIITLDTTANSSVEDIQEITQGKSSKIWCVYVYIYI